MHPNPEVTIPEAVGDILQSMNDELYAEHEPSVPGQVLIPSVQLIEVAEPAGMQSNSVPVVSVPAGAFPKLHCIALEPSGVHVNDVT